MGITMVKVAAMVKDTETAKAAVMAKAITRMAKVAATAGMVKAAATKKDR